MGRWPARQAKRTAQSDADVYAMKHICRFHRFTTFSRPFRTDLINRLQGVCKSCVTLDANFMPTTTWTCTKCKRSTVFLFGDSHANFNFKGLKYPNRNLHTNSVTMHRVGRDGKKFIDFSKKGIKKGDIVIYQFGEVDCRAHVGKQLVLGRDLETIIRELADPYISSIVENAKAYSNLKLIVCSVPPPVPHTEESLLEDHKKTNPFPVVHSNEERVLYTKTLNTRLKEKCLENNIQFFDYYSH
jgi:hypothetical protein